MVPAILVLRQSVAKRVMEWMPDSPAVSRFQLSAFPAPSGVTRPLPVTTTTGRPALSCMAAIPTSQAFAAAVSVDPLDQRQALAAPVPDAGHDRLGERVVGRPLEPRRVLRSKQRAPLQRNGRQRNIHGKL